MKLKSNEKIWHQRWGKKKKLKFCTITVKIYCCSFLWDIEICFQKAKKLSQQTNFNKKSSLCIFFCYLFIKTKPIVTFSDCNFLVIKYALKTNNNIALWICMYLCVFMSFSLHHLLFIVILHTAVLLLNVSHFQHSYLVNLS